MSLYNTNPGINDFSPYEINFGLVFEYEVVQPDDALGKTSQEDLLTGVASVVANDVAPSKIPFGFMHALSRIFVKATNTTGETAVIKSLRLMNVYSKGEVGRMLRIIGLNQVDVDVFYYGIIWSNFNTPVNYKFALAETGVAVPADTTKAQNAPAKLVTSMEQGMLIIPQEVVNTGNPATFDSGDFALEVVYDLSNLENQTKYITLTPYPSMFRNTYRGFEPNKQYAITVNFTNKGITFDIEVSEFEDIVNVP